MGGDFAEEVWTAAGDELLPASEHAFQNGFRLAGRFLLARACLKIGDVSSREGFWAAGKQFFRRNPVGFQGNIAPYRGQKPRRLGMLTCFKQALDAFHFGLRLAREFLID